jgi:hypothetical protein
MDLEASMDIPIRFPHPADVIAEEAERFRRLSPPERVRELIEVVEVGLRQLQESPRRSEIEAQILESEEAWQESQRRVFKRHGR